MWGCICICYHYAMIERFRQGKLVWVNMKNPTIEEVQQIMLSLDISPSLMTDLTTFVPKNTVVRFDDIIKITLDFPVIKRLEMGHEYEIKFLVSKNFLVTVHYEEMSSIDRFKRQFEVASTLHKKRKGYTGAHLFMSLFVNLYDSALAKLDYVETKLTEIEADIFKDNEKQMVYEISRVSKQLISFRHTLHSHEDVLLEEAVIDDEPRALVPGFAARGVVGEERLHHVVVVVRLVREAAPVRVHDDRARETPNGELGTIERRAVVGLTGHLDGGRPPRLGHVAELGADRHRHLERIAGVARW